ncbi:MAG TPA: HEPN domain-containing protein [Terricaulis sp.]|nr:HEPN domain-containing protein [Terricaulis sp.]
MTFYDAYEPHLTWADSLTKNVLAHAPPPGPPDDSFRADLAGLLCTAYVAAFECCVKSVFTSFAKKKRSKILANVAGFHFAQINSKIHWNVLADTYANQFGPIYRTKFLELLNAEEQSVLASDKVSVRETYANVLKWRHAFAHEGKKLTTLEEISAAYPYARRVITVLDNAMNI